MFIIGEVTTEAKVGKDEVSNIAVDVCSDCGYTDPLDISVTLVEQSTEIASGVDDDGAGDQGTFPDIDFM